MKNSKSYKKTIGILILCFAVLLAGCSSIDPSITEVYANANTQANTYENLVAITTASGNTTTHRATQRGELRGIWVASVWNIDYPRAATTNDTILRNEAIEMLDTIQSMGFNTIYFQVRPTSDALYRSEIFPWSHWLTGEQGRAPANNFDPLAFWIEEAHKRGMELHAWLNPYRITSRVADNYLLHPSNPAARYPELTILHTDGRLYFDPGNPRARQLIIDGIEEILRNYNVDGIHLDDYFYPGIDFPDADTFRRYGAGFNNINDWRRHSVTELIKGIQAVVRETKPSAQFGISPFGIWANRDSHPHGSATSGNESFTRMFADTRLWVQNGYIDYIMPQLYWHIGFDRACYEILLNWWTNVVQGTNVRLYIGLGAYRVVDVAETSVWYRGEELRRQVAMNRQNSTVSGHVFFTYNSFIRVPVLQDLMREIHGEQAIFPDIIGLPQRESIEYVASHGIIRGFPDGLFHPHQNIRRGDFVLMLMRMFDMTTEIGHPNFADVDIEDHFYNEIATARARGLVQGIDGVNFAPFANITNQDLYVMAYRALYQMGAVTGQADESVLAQFTDGNEIAYYAREAIAYFTERGVFTGNAINPTRTADRANAAEFIANVVRTRD